MLAVFLLIEIRGFTVYQNLLVSIVLEFKLLNYCCFAFLRTFVQVYASARFIEFISQFQPYHDFFS